MWNLHSGIQLRNVIPGNVKLAFGIHLRNVVPGNVKLALWDPSQKCDSRKCETFPLGSISEMWFQEMWNLPSGIQLRNVIPGNEKLALWDPSQKCGSRKCETRPLGFISEMWFQEMWNFPSKWVSGTSFKDDLSRGCHIFKKHGYFKFSIVQHRSPDLLVVFELKLCIQI